MRGERALDLGRVLEALERHDVAYVIIGGIASLAHGSPLPTVDVDVCPAYDADNLGRLARALRDLGAKLAPPGADPIDFPLDGASLGQFVSACFVTDAGDVDVVMWPDGIERGYRGLVGNAVRVELHGHDVRIAALDDIITSKRAAGRAKDVGALPYLERLRELRERPDA